MTVNRGLISDFNVGIFTGLSIGLAVGFYFRSRPLSLSLIENLRKIVIERQPKNPEGDAEYKMILVVNQKLKMEKGKTASQCCHAAVSIYTKTLLKEPSKIDFWLGQGSKKIALKAVDDEHLERIQKLANASGLISTLVRDRGLTQISPGSKTVLGIGPDQASLINKVVGDLKLY